MKKSNGIYMKLFYDAPEVFVYEYELRLLRNGDCREAIIRKLRQRSLNKRNRNSRIQINRAYSTRMKKVEESLKECEV